MCNVFIEFDISMKLASQTKYVGKKPAEDFG